MLNKNQKNKPKPTRIMEREIQIILQNYLTGNSMFYSANLNLKEHPHECNQLHLNKVSSDPEEPVQLRKSQYKIQANIYSEFFF